MPIIKIQAMVSDLPSIDWGEDDDKENGEISKNSKKSLKKQNDEAKEYNRELGRQHQLKQEMERKIALQKQQKENKDK